MYAAYFRVSAFLLSLPLLLSSSSRVSTHDARQIRISIADSPSLPVLAVSWRISVSLPLDLFRAPISRSDGQPSEGCPAFAASTRLPWNRKATPGQLAALETHIHDVTVVFRSAKLSPKNVCLRSNSDLFFLFPTFLLSELRHAPHATGQPH